MCMKLGKSKHSNGEPWKPYDDDNVYDNNTHSGNIIATMAVNIY